MLEKLSDRVLVATLLLRGFQSRRISTSEGIVHALDAPGRGPLPPLIALHGFAAAAHWYAGVLLRMRPHARRVIAPDLLGHGLSEMPRSGLDLPRLGRALLEVVDALLDRPAIVFGNSLGGAAALRLAIARPDRVAGLFLVAPGGAPMDRRELAAFVERFRLRGHSEALDFVDRLFARPHPMRHLLAWATRRRFARKGLGDLLDRIAPDDLLCPSDLARLSMPIQLLWGGADRILTPAHLDFFHRHLPPHAQIQVLDHYGHTPHIDHPEDLHARLLAFARHVASVSAERPIFARVFPISPPSYPP